MNRFNERLDSQKYVSTYVPLPLEFIAQQGAGKQKEYDTVKKSLADSALENIKSISEHDDARNSYVKGFNDQAQALIGDPNLDFGSSEGQSKVYNLIRQHADNPQIQILTRSIENKKKQLGDIEALKKIEGGYGYWNDPTIMDEKLRQSGEDPYIDKNTGQAKEYEYRPVQRAEDHEKGVEEIFNNLQESGNFQAYAGFNKDQTAISEGGRGWTGITTATIRDITEKTYGVFLKSDAGSDWLRRFKFDNSEGLSQLSLKDREEAIIGSAKSYMNSIGDTYVRIKQTEKAGLKTTSLHGDAEREAKVKNNLESTLAPGDTNNNGQLLAGKQFSEFFNYSSDGKTILKNTDGSASVNYTKLADAFNNKPEYSGLTKLFMESNYVAPLNTPFKKKHVSPSEFQTKIVNFAKTMGLKSIGETLEYLQNASISANPIVLPTTEIAKGLGEKIGQQFNKEQMKDATGTSYTALYSSLAGDGGTSNFQGLDLSDRNNPQFKYEFVTKDGKISNASVSIPNNNYVNALKPIAKIVNDVSDIQMGKTIANPKSIEVGSLVISAIKTSRPDIMNDLGIKNAADLAPVYSEKIPGGTLYVYNNKLKKGSVKAIEVMDSYQDTNGNKIKGSVTGIANFGDYITTRVDDDFVFPVSGDILSKKKAEMYSNSSSESDQSTYDTPD